MARSSFGKGKYQCFCDIDKAFFAHAVQAQSYLAPMLLFIDSFNTYLWARLQGKF